MRRLHLRTSLHIHCFHRIPGKPLCAGSLPSQRRFKIRDATNESGLLTEQTSFKCVHLSLFVSDELLEFGCGGDPFFVTALDASRRKVEFSCQVPHATHRAKARTGAS